MVITFDELTLYITVYITDVQYYVNSFKGFFLKYLDFHLEIRKKNNSMAL